MAKDWEQLKKHWVNLFRETENWIFDSIERSCKSPIECIAAFSINTLIEEYGSKNLRCQPQVRIGKFVVDFEVIYKPFHLQEDDKPQIKIVVECDGHEWHEKTKEQASKDKARDRELQKLGYIILRYSGSDLYKDWRIVRNDIYDLLDPNEKIQIEKWIKEQRESGAI